MTLADAQAALEAELRKEIRTEGWRDCGYLDCSHIWCATIRLLAELDLARAAEAEKCPTCGGKGRYKENPWSCAACNGTGRTRMAEVGKCWKCDGAGWLVLSGRTRALCPVCVGTGRAKPPPDDPPMLLCSGEPDCECAGCKLGTGKASGGRKP